MKTLNSRYVRNVLLAAKEQHHHVLAKAGRAVAMDNMAILGVLDSWPMWISSGS
jgi:hypothetical protein